MKIPAPLTTKVDPHPAAQAVTALAMGTAGVLVLRRIPKPVRRPAELLLAASSPWVASYLTQLGRVAYGRLAPRPPDGVPDGAASAEPSTAGAAMPEANAGLIPTRQAVATLGVTDSQ